MHLNSIRREYTLGTLDVQHAGHEPVQLFGKWMKEAVSADVHEPTAMSLSTMGVDGYPQSRVVLLKSFDVSGFTFFTNYLSQKGYSLTHEPRAALLFFWPELQRQVRITGDVAKVTREVTESYFVTRPRGSRIGAWASEQSCEIPSREYLESRFDEIDARYSDDEILVPEHWGGYLVSPLRIEFWQGRESRLHDRILFTRLHDRWDVTRLAP